MGAILTLTKEFSMTESILTISERIENSIYLIRGQKVMLDRDLALLYGVETKAITEQLSEILAAFLRISCFS
jgi:hypothetical protein